MNNPSSSKLNPSLIQVLYELTDLVAENRSRPTDQQLFDLLRAKGLHDDPEAIKVTRAWGGLLHRVVINNSFMPLTLQRLEESGVSTRDAQVVVAKLTGTSTPVAEEANPVEPEPEKSEPILVEPELPEGESVRVEPDQSTDRVTLQDQVTLDTPAAHTEKSDQPQPEHPEKISAWEKNKVSVLQKSDPMEGLASPAKPKQSKLWMLIVGIIALLGAGIAAIFLVPRSPVYAGGIYFMSDRDGSWEIYYLNDGETKQMTSTADNRDSKYPSLSWNDMLYFASNRDGKLEIYRLKNESIPERMTWTEGTAESYMPALCMDGYLYFTSNRTGQANIFNIGSDGVTRQITQTGGSQLSNDPACRFGGILYFSSSRTGIFEIYRLTSDGIEQLTSTPNGGYSTQPAVGAGGEVYFTSTRDGKREIYIIDMYGTHRLTNTAQGESWGPVVNQKGELYFTSDRDGEVEVYFYDFSGIAKRMTFTEGLATSKTR